MSEGSLPQSNEVRALQVLHIFECYSISLQCKRAFKYQIIIYSRNKMKGWKDFCLLKSAVHEFSLQNRIEVDYEGLRLNGPCGRYPRP